jgi:hypothetical protein
MRCYLHARRIGIIIGVTFITVGIGLHPRCGLSDELGPRVSITQESHNLGEFFENESPSHTFVIQNSGNAPLAITKVEPDCVCTVPDHDKVIPAGGQGKVTLTIKPFSVHGEFEKKTTVKVNDPQTPEFVLTLKGDSKSLIEISPSRIIKLRGTPSENVQAQVRFISHYSFPWEIKEFRTNVSDKIDIALKSEKQGKVYLLEVRNKRQEAGSYAGMIELFTSSKEQPRLIVRVFCDLDNPPAKSQ